MAERASASSPELDDQAIAQALHTRAATIRDVAYGEGVQFSAGRGTLRLEIYPRTGVTRLTGADIRIELFGNAVAQVSDSGVEFARVQPGQEANLTVLSDAGVVFTFISAGHPVPETPQEPVKGPQPRENNPTRPDAHHAPGQDDAADAATPNSPTRDSQGARTPGTERGTLVKFTGRLGKDPFISGKRGVPHVRLSVGEHYQDDNGQEQTRWHEVWAANTNSDTVKRMAEEGKLHHGSEVRVRGYRHERGPDASGRPQRPFVRAFQIDLTKKPTPRRVRPGESDGER